MNSLKGARRDYLQSEKFGLRTADSGTAHGICGRRWRQPGRCSTWRRSGCSRYGQRRRWRRSAGGSRWRWPPGRRGGGWIAGIGQPGRQRSGWNGQPKQKCWRLPRKWHQCFTGDNKRHDHRRRYRWFCGRPVRARFAWRSLASGLRQPIPIRHWCYGAELSPRRCRGGAIIDDRASQARTRRCVDGDSSAASMWRSGSRNRRNDDLHRYFR